MGLIQRWKEFRKYQKEERATLEELILSAGLTTGAVTKEQALNIPSVSACVEVIGNTVASLPIHLYQDVGDKVKEIKNDVRLSLLNDDTKDTLDAFQFRKAIVEDYLLHGGGYAYINRQRNTVKSLHYVDNRSISVSINADPIFKRYDILVNGMPYRDFEFIKVTRKTKDGVLGTGIISENNKILSVSYNSLNFEEVLVKTGGNKKGFLKSQNRLAQETIDALKTAWKNLYSNNSENVIVLNNGLEFQEASNTSVEMQLNENKKTNATEISKIFLTPQAILDGTATDKVYNNWIKICIMPILKAILTALNKDLLLPSEKDKSFYFAVDANELLKGDMETRYKAYSEAVKAGWISKNEVRFREDLEPIEGLDIVTMSLGEVIYDIKSKKYFTPNTDSIMNSNMEGGEENENRDPGGSGTP